MNKPIHLLVDTGNLFHRAIAFGKTGGSEDEIVAMTMAAASSLISNVFDMFGASHTMLAFESKSWRRNVFPEYKAGRRQVQMTKKEEQIQKLLYESIDRFRTFLHNETNASPIRADAAEGDDVIARWIELHPEAEHIIVSSDGDMQQLVRPGVSTYSSQQGKCWTDAGILISEENMLRKTLNSFQRWNGTWRLSDDPFDPQWTLFQKIMRGDRGDSVPTAVKPRTRTKLIEEAYKDPAVFGEMLSAVREDLPHRPTVGDLVKRNAELVDLSYRPDSVNASIDAVVADLKARELKSRVGLKYQVFCRENGMARAGQLAQKFVRPYSFPSVPHETST